MMRVKKNMFKVCAILGIFLALIKVQNFKVESNDIQNQELLLGNLKKNSEDQDSLETADKENLESIDTSTEKEISKNIATSIKSEGSVSDNNNSRKSIKVELTAYSNDKRCSDNWNSQTAMGTETRVGVVAAPKNIPLGSKLYIPELKNYKEDGIFDVEDRGGAIKMKKDGTYIIDVWMPTYEEAVQFGRKTTTVYIAA
ncbi:3D domain-containing protein [Clostridium saccharobutylicum]|uniref:3D domain protein n=1 Tax=Clostridium saccharobutylicum DSM 13864 TaxID=1345695 RepID=U5MPT3_CLOSA|nr:3D domain-containing protein [Clostridium saccharobutylicum]AGX42518.1 3D domain protein [Clostridium saccharobutylicum DSM 13864]AQR89804.1 hypothetical protein CLOSC_15070 [Clostridium saccharobutylicum]AQR99706.1 hypothetical protein CSACC_15150 [Clostridium saccharobutylicum]AQS09436.1 hypothetical protein CLOBY_15630 [Clostridium saccharobutylicum]AQS13692.1 hypothetical protein CLOSACC_15150 [Clostridium saccharobutylicum]